MKNEVIREADSSEFIGWVGTVAKYGTLLVGGLCLLTYSNEIGHFPEGIGLGEGLAFYLVCACFLIAYTLYAVLCTAAGCLLLVWPAQVLDRRLARRENVAQQRVGQMPLLTDFSSMRDPGVLATGVVGWVIFALYVHGSPGLLPAFLGLLMLVAQGFGVICLLIVNRRHQHFESDLLVPNWRDQLTPTRRRDTVVTRRVLWSWLAIAPFLLAPEKLFFVDAAFRLAQLRKDTATIHVKAPWSVRVSESSLPKASSILGSEYVEFKKVNVLLRSVGQKVIVELPTKSGVVKLAIPADAIYVE
jgi:hypothetical protein